MHNHYPAPRTRDPVELIPPVAVGRDSGNPEELAGRRGEQRDTHKRVLLVEDEFLLSAVLSADLQEAGYDVLGPCATVAAAMDAVQSESLDGAILDINLRGELVYPVAEELARRRIPFMFLSGYAVINMPESFRGHTRLAKPAELPVLLREIQKMLRESH